MGKAKQKDIFSVLGHGLLDTRKCRALLACNERLAEAPLCKCSSGGLCTHSGTQQKARYYPGENCGAGRRSASYRAICPTVSHWLGCMGQRSRLLHSVPITEVKHNLPRVHWQGLARLYLMVAGCVPMSLCKTLFSKDITFLL